MPPGASTPSAPASPGRFLRGLGIVALLLLGVIGAGAVLVPYFGRLLDFVLHQTAYRHWTQLTLQSAPPFFDVSTPQQAVKSYYSALYHGDMAAMEQVTAGPFRDQMRQRLAHTLGTVDVPLYTSYLETHGADAQTAVVVEKFHLFWSHGLRFTLQRQTMGWAIVGIELLE
jgi:hypothetical protein